MERRYSALRFVAVLMKIIGALSIIAGAAGAVSGVIPSLNVETRRLGISTAITLIAAEFK